MSTLQDDKEVLKGRKNKLADAEVSLRDQIPEKLYRKLDEMDFAEKIMQVWSSGSSEKNTWIQRQSTFLANWDEFLTNEAAGPFDGASNLHIPMTFTICKAYHARMLQALTADDFSYPAKARREDHVDREELVRETIRYALKEWVNYGKGISETLDKWIWDWVTTGLGLKKWRWERCFERFEDVEDVVVPGIPRYEVGENGEDILVPTVKKEEREVIKTVEVFDGPVCENISIEDLFWKGHTDPNFADITIHRQWLSASELWSLVDQKIFKEEEVRELISGGDHPKTGGLNADLKVQRMQSEGGTQIDSDNDLDRYEILECYAKVDVNGSGISSEIVAWVGARTGCLLRATYLRRISKSGTRPFVRADFIRTSAHEFPKGLPEILHPLQVELDAIRNMKVDFGMLSTMPFFFYRSSSSIEKEDLQLAPGAGIAVDNPQSDVFFPQIGNRSFFGANEEQAIMSIVERLTGINDVTLGSLSGQQGVTRTASGVRALVTESNSNLNVHLRRLNEGWKQSLQVCFKLLQQKMKPGFAFRVTGLDGGDYFAKIRDVAALYGDYDFELSPNSETSNSAARVDNATQILNTVMNTVNIQLGIVTPQEIYNANKNYLQALGIKDYSRYLNRPVPMTNKMLPEEEFNRVIRGIEVPVTPEMNHDGYINYFQTVLRSDELLGQFTEKETLLAAAQAQAHADMKQALEQIAAQQANQAQMSMNAQSGMNLSQGGVPAQQAQQPQGGEA